MPVLASAGRDQVGPVGLGHRVAGDLHEQHQGVEVLRQHHIAAAAEHDQRQALRARVSQGGQQVGFAAHVHGKARAHVESECIVAAQGIKFEEICHARER